MLKRLLIVVALLTLLSDGGICQTAQPAQSDIPNVLRAGARIELVKDGLHGLEGPVPTPDGGLYFSAIDENRTYKLDKAGNITVWRENTNRTNGLYLRHDGVLLGAEGGGKRIVSIAPDGAVSVLASGYAGKPLREPNDLIADRKGGVYFTDPAPRPAPNMAAKEPGNVYYIRPDGKLLLIDDKITRPNGISLSLDQKTLYVDDTEGEYVYAFNIQPDGSATNKRQFTKLHDPEQGSLGLRSRADGMALDSDGRLYVATASGIQVIDPSGKYLGPIRLPAVARNLAFGGPDRHTLYLTALTALYRVNVLSNGPPDRSK